MKGNTKFKFGKIMARTEHRAWYTFWGRRSNGQGHKFNRMPPVCVCYRRLQLNNEMTRKFVRPF